MSENCPSFKRIQVAAPKAVMPPECPCDPCDPCNPVHWQWIEYFEENSGEARGVSGRAIMQLNRIFRQVEGPDAV